MKIAIFELKDLERGRFDIFKTLGHTVIVKEEF